MIRYIIEIPLNEVDGTWRKVCECISAEGVSEVVRAMLRWDENPPTIRIVPIRT